ncbi:MAG: hypothetical protein PHP59_00130 [Methanofollis sp.]|uniref:hypothetical protein n=1 Tax=Methanofollis sp. TaxID=2052835 RepID=UPI00261F156A|nr:hypothetical protein [Methanofollis sp.]MDD4253772.1 hypothetical protein [Methanofollis sp.]
MQVRIPPMLAELVVAAISAIDGVVFSGLTRCPACGGPVRGHDMKKRRFAVIQREKGRREITVWVKRYHCTACGAFCTADAPFYPETRVGSPVVDLCLVLTADLPANHAARILSAMGVVLDRGSVQNYAARRAGPVSSTLLYGLRLPNSLLSLIPVAIGRYESGPVPGAEVLAACGFPSADRTPLHPLRRKEGDERDEEEEKEKRETEEVTDRGHEDGPQKDEEAQGEPLRDATSRTA